MSFHKVVVVASFLATPPRGHYGKHYHYSVYYKQDIFYAKKLGPCTDKDPERTIAVNMIQQKQDRVYLQIAKGTGGYKWKRGALCFFRQTMEP
jgi:hypothetical protein